MTTCSQSVEAYVLVVEAAPPVRLRVYDTVAELEVNSKTLALLPGGTVELPFKVKRLQNFKGELKVELVPPRDLSGVTAAPLTLNANQTDGKLTLKAAANVKSVVSPAVVVRVAGTINGKTLTHEVKVTVAVGKDKIAALPAVAYSRAAARSVAAGTPVIGSTDSGECCGSAIKAR